MAGTAPELPRGPFTLAFMLGSIPVAIEPSFWIMGLLIGSSAGLNGALAWTGVVLISVMLHELGHALMAMAFGSSARIRLYSLGGLTYHERLSRLPSVLTSLAGPFAGFILGGGILLYEHYFPVENPRLDWLLDQFKWANLGWGAINLLPVLPLDGGHVLSGILGSHRTRAVLVISTAVAALVSAFGFYVHYSFLGLMFGFFAFRGGVALSQLGKPAQPEGRPAPPPSAPQPGAEVTFLERGWQALSVGDDAEAERVAREVLTSTVEPVGRNRALDLMAWVDLARGDASGAMRQLERIQPADEVRALTRAMVYEAAGLNDRALPPAMQAFAKEPSEASAQLAIRLLTGAGRYDEAEQIAEAYAWPKPGIKESALGGVRHARGDFSVAAKLLQLAFEMRKRPTDAFNAACSLARAGDAQSALTWLSRSVDAGLDDAGLLESDPDLAPARALPGFAALLDRARARRAMA